MNQSQNLKEAAAKGESVKFKNTLQKSRTLKITFTADNDQATAASSPVYLFAARGRAADKALLPGVTISGDFTSAADYYDMIQNTRFGVEEIKLETADTANYEGTRMIIGVRNLNNRNNQEQDLLLSDFQQSTGNGLKKTAKFDIDALGGGIMVDPLFYGQFVGVKKNTSVTFYIKVSHVEAVGEMDAADF